MGQGCPAQAALAVVALEIRLPPQYLSAHQWGGGSKLRVNKENYTGWGGVGLKITVEELQDQKKRFSASKHKNNFLTIMLLTEDRSLNYSLAVVYRGPISSFTFSSVHLSISSHLILILSESVARLRNSSGNQSRVCRQPQQNISKVKLLMSHNSLTC